MNPREPEEVLPKRCAYCGEVSPPGGFVTREVIHREFNPWKQKQVVKSSSFTVCRDTGCGGKLQMSYEG